MAKPRKAGRDYGGGSLYQRSSDGMWVGTIEAGWNDKGGRRRIVVYGKDERTARVKMREKQRLLELQMDTGVNPRATVKSWALEWLPIVVRKQRPQTYRQTVAAVHRWIIPTIGHKRFAQLNPADVRAVSSAVRAAGLKSSTALRVHSVLMPLLKAAAIEGHPVSERLFKVEPPSANASDRKPMTVPGAVGVLGAAAEFLPHSSRFAAALLQGMRQGEALGLTWSSIDFETNTMLVQWQLQPLSYNVKRDRSSGFRIPERYQTVHLKDRWHLVELKSESGYRAIPMVPWMAAALRAWREVAPASPHDLVWPTLDGGPTNPKDDDAEWYGLQEAAQVGHPDGRYYGIHEARHTTGTLLLEARIDPAVIKAILGHASFTTSQTYMHVNTRPALDAMTAVAERLKLAPGEGA